MKYAQALNKDRIQATPLCTNAIKSDVTCCCILLYFIIFKYYALG